MAEKTAAGLIAHALALRGSPYMWGTYGKIITNDLINQKVKQYPGHYKDAYVKKLRGYVGTGRRSIDCCGLIKAFFMQDGDPAKEPKYLAQYDKNVGGMKAACTQKGAIGTLPEIPGLLLFMNNAHVGIYLGGGKAVEAVGSDVVKVTTVKGRGWTDWGKLGWITYPATQPPCKPCASLVQGDRVRFRAGVTHYYPGGIKIPPARLTQIFTVGGARAGKGVPCVLLTEISSSAWVENLEKVED